MTVLKKEVNTIVYCNVFKIHEEIEDHLKQPESGRVYEGHFHEKTNELVVRVNSPEKIYTYIVDGTSGKNDSFEFEFIPVTEKNIEDLHFHDDDLELVANFLADKNFDPIVLKDGMVVEEETGIATFHHNDEDDEYENAETEEFIEKIMNAAKEDTDRLNNSINAMNFLLSRDPVFAASIQNLLIYLASIYDVKTPLDLSGFVMSDEGKSFNVGTAAYYLSTYMSSNKGGNTEDLNKAIQFCLFELTRKTNSK